MEHPSFNCFLLQLVFVPFSSAYVAACRACLALLHLFSAAFDAALDCCDAGLLLQVSKAQQLIFANAGQSFAVGV
jgi:hypothetical protein